MKLSQVIGLYLVLILLLSLSGAYFSETINVKQPADGSMIGFALGALISLGLYYQFGRDMVLKA